MNPVNITFINNEGTGFAGPETVAPGTTVGAFFAQKMGTANPANYQISVNREIADRNYTLVEGDKVSFTPGKVAGAR